MKKFIPLMMAAVMLSSCTQTLYMGRVPQTHFTYPNSNVSPLNQVSGESNAKIKLFTPPGLTSSIINEAYYNALSKAPGSDGIINANAYQVITLIPLYVIQLYIMKYRIEGTAAKQEIGKQVLK